MRRAARALVCMLAFGGSHAAAQEAPRPALTVGDVALLANASDSDNAEPLRQALVDPDPRVRAVAGRVAGVGGRADLWNAVMGALAREHDDAAGAELVRDVLYVGGASAIDPVRSQVRRLGATSAIVFAGWLARTQPNRFIELLPELITAAGSDGRYISRAVQTAIVQHPGQAAQLRRTWMAHAPDGEWGSFLSATFLPPESMETDAELFEAALSSERAPVREETLWFIVNALADTRHLPDKILDAALPRDNPGQTPWESFGRELIARRRRNVRAADASDLLKAEWPRHRSELTDLAALPELTDSERTVLTGLAGQRRARAPRPGGAPSLRTVAGVTAGVIASALDRAGCHPKQDEALGFALLTFRADGRPKRVEIAETGLTPSCKSAFTALARVAVADADYGAIESPQGVILPMTPGFLACTSEPASPLAAGRSVGGDITTPHKTRDLKPVYPRSAQEQGIQGTVIIEAQVTPGGCINSARIVQSIPALDVAALRAVLGWKYSPTLLQGRPVPVLMTVTVNFALR
jgi:TonB family protein